MIEDGAEELFGGFWPFMQRIIVVFLPLWVYLLCWSAGLHILISAIAAGSSVSLVVVIEKLRLRHESKLNDDLR